MTLKTIQIRKTTSNDFNEIMDVETQAFGSDKEAQLTAELLADSTATPYLSLLAFHNGEAIGHILFTRVYLDKMEKEQPLAHILAPLAVKPAFQKQGVGGQLIQEGLKRLQTLRSEMVFVLGHMEYYPKFGFIPDAGKIGYAAPYTIPDEFANAWMVQSINPEGFTLPKGNVICSNELNKPEHWRE